MVRKRRVSKKLYTGESEEIQQVTPSFLELVQRYRLYCIIGSIIILLGIVGFFFWKYLSIKKEEKAATLFYQAHEMYQTSIKEEKLLDEPLKLLESVPRQYPGTAAELLSLFYIGNCQFAMKKFDEAIASYDKFAQDIPPESHMALLAYDSLGYCYEEKKDYKRAIEYFEKTVTPPPGLGESGYLNVARCYETIGEKENALKTYKKILVEYPNSPRIDFVQEKIQMLEAKG